MAHDHDHDHDHSHDESDGIKHWPLIAVVVIVGLIFCVHLFTFQASHTEHVILTRFGKPKAQVESGRRVKLPYPIDKVWTVDNRIHCFDGKAGAWEEVFTKDEMNIIVSTYICWKVHKEHVEKFMVKVDDIAHAEDDLTALLRSYKNGVIGQYTLDQLINVEPDKIKIEEIEEQMKTEIADKALELYGIEIKQVGIKHLGFPESVTSTVFDRMKASREAKSVEIRSQGDRRSAEIRAKADSLRKRTLADANSEAKRIRAEGDVKAAEHFTVFAQNAELAKFLLDLNALEVIMAEKTTVVLDTRSAPFNLLRGNALDNVKKKTGN
jgi:membrane protease subunit HflC